METKLDDFTDTHTLYVHCGCATKKQIVEAIEAACKAYMEEHKETLKCNIKVNLVENRDGVSFNFAFVFLTNSAVYHMLLGKNPDGTDRIEYYDDPSWIKPVEPETVEDENTICVQENKAVESVEEVADETVDEKTETSVMEENINGIKTWMDFDNEWGCINTGMNWADVMDAEDKVNDVEEKVEGVKSIRPEYVCPKLARHLPPLMVLNPITLTPEQIAAEKAKLGENATVSPTVQLSLDSAKANSVGNKYMPNILKTLKNPVPEWVTKDDIKREFSGLVSDGVTVHKRTVRGKKIEETYPFVNISDDRVAFVIFDPSTTDAYFALHMMKKTIIKKTLPNKESVSTTLIFGHSFRTDRDIITQNYNFRFNPDTYPPVAQTPVRPPSHRSTHHPHNRPPQNQAPSNRSPAQGLQPPNPSPDNQSHPVQSASNRQRRPVNLPPNRDPINRQALHNSRNYPSKSHSNMHFRTQPSNSRAAPAHNPSPISRPPTTPLTTSASIKAPSTIVDTSIPPVDTSTSSVKSSLAKTSVSSSNNPTVSDNMSTKSNNIVTTHTPNNKRGTKAKVQPANKATNQYNFLTEE